MLNHLLNYGRMEKRSSHDISLERHLLVYRQRWGKRSICIYQSTEFLSVLLILIDIVFILDPTFYFYANPEQDLAPTLKLGQINNRQISIAPYKTTAARLKHVLAFPKK
jgi:hypothetical protein